MTGVELVAGTLVVIAVRRLHVAIKKGNGRSSDFTSTLDRLEYRIKLLTSKIEEIDPLNQEREDAPREEIRVFLQQLEEARDLVSTCSDIPSWDLYKKHKYRKRLKQLDSSLEKLSMVELQIPSKREPRTPSKRELQTPSKGELQTPSKGELQTPSKRELQTPSKGELQIPSKRELQTPSKRELQTPSKGELQTAQALDIQRVMLDVVQNNLVNLVSWVTMSIVSLLFLWGSILRLFGKEPPNMSGVLEISDRSVVEVANSITGLVEEAVRWMFNTSAERRWFVFAQGFAALVLLYYLGTFTNLLTLLYIGIAMGMVISVLYGKYGDKIKRCGEMVKVKSGTFMTRYVTQRMKNESIDES